jgi:hypothetical protein
MKQLELGYDDPAARAALMRDVLAAGYTEGDAARLVARIMAGEIMPGLAKVRPAEVRPGEIDEAGERHGA